MLAYNFNISFNVIILLFLSYVINISHSKIWNQNEIINYMTSHPQRAYFTHLFCLGGYRTGMEVGVAQGRFSELFLLINNNIGNWNWVMVEPYPTIELIKRYPLAGHNNNTTSTTIDNELNWQHNDIGRNANIIFFKEYSTSQSFINQLQLLSYDFIYLDGAHDYKNVLQEIILLWPYIKPGGMLAGHDYCNYGEPNLPCNGCENIPQCKEYTSYGKLNKPGKRAHNQNDVVRAVQEWLMISENSHLKLYHTQENFSRESLHVDNINYDLVITSTYNPSWFIIKPL